MNRISSWISMLTLALALTLNGLLPSLAQSGLNMEIARGLLQQSRQACRSMDNGTLEVAVNAVIEYDLTGDGTQDVLIDQSEIVCSSSVSLYCGTGGCGLIAIADGKTTEFLVKGWNIMPVSGGPVLLMAVHGSQCGGDNLTRCFNAVVWSEGKFQTVAPPYE